MKNFNSILKAPLTWIICGAVMIIGLSVFVILKCTPSSISSAWFEGQGENDTYEFPVYERTEQLGDFETINFLQIPEDILKNMSTEGLIESCINYPSFGNIMFYDSFQYAFEKLCTDFNGLQELYKREDSAEKLVRIFESINLEKLEKTELSSLRYRYICLMVSQNEIILNLTPDQQEQLLNTIQLQKKLISKKFTNIYSQSSVMLIEYRLYKELYTEFREMYDSNTYLKSFVDTGVWMDISKDDFNDLLYSIDKIIYTHKISAP